VAAIEELAGGGREGAQRRGDHVVRRRRPWTDTVLALLRHLEDVGYAYSPRVVDDQQDEVVAYIEGSPAPECWSDEGISQVGEALRQLHDATASFAPEQPVWQDDWWVRYRGADSLIGHGDPGPWNVIEREGLPVALIDWEFAGPVHRLHEVAHAGWLNCQLHDDDVAERQSLLPAADRARQLGLFLDGYGLARAEREGFVERLVEVAVLSAANDVIEARVTQETTDAASLWGVTWRVRGGAWMLRNRALLEAAIMRTG
jgi:hypothetical protein